MSDQIELRLASMNLMLPQPPRPTANYAGAVQTGNLMFVAGHGPVRDGVVPYVGRVDTAVSVADAYEAARLATLSALASLKAVIGSLDRVRRIVKLLGMVNSDPTFTRHSEVINGASDLLTAVFGDRGLSRWIYMRDDHTESPARRGRFVALPHTEDGRT